VALQAFSKDGRAAGLFSAERRISAAKRQIKREAFYFRLSIPQDVVRPNCKIPIHGFKRQ
jgi:hypothetical protein